MATCQILDLALSSDGALGGHVTLMTLLPFRLITEFCYREVPRFLTDDNLNATALKYKGKKRQLEDYLLWKNITNIHVNHDSNKEL